MSVTAKALINARFAQSATTSEYTAPVSTHVIIDKFTATNADSSARTLSVYIVPSGASAASSNGVVLNLSIAAGATVDITSLQNQILNPGDSVAIVASAGTTIVVRMSGREVS